jgi:hypothetical protein
MEGAGNDNHQFIDSVYQSICLRITIDSNEVCFPDTRPLIHERIRSCDERKKISLPAPYMQWNRRISQPMKLLRSSIPSDFLCLERKGKTALVESLCLKVPTSPIAYPVLGRAEEYCLVRE